MQNPTLEDLGPRICIMGPSNSGKSTLAAAIGRARGLVTVHLDQLYHQPDTDWRPRPPHEFADLHDAAILREAWVLDGNYSRWLPQRLGRATGLILLDVPTPVSLFRYVRRCWSGRDRRGGLPGGADGVRWAMVRHIAITTRRNRRRYAAMFAGLGLPEIRLSTTRELARFYRSERLER